MSDDFNKISNDIYKDNQFPQTEEKMGKITDMDRLLLGRYILIGLAFLFFSGMVISAFSKDCMIFDACKTALLPFAGVILGYYFRENES